MQVKRMDVWQFWLGIGIIFALVGVMIAVLVRKHKDKHRIRSIQKNLEDLELSFTHLSEDIEIAVNQNIKTMEEKCETMRELLTHADKKCILANDLIVSLENDIKLFEERKVVFQPQIFGNEGTNGEYHEDLNLLNDAVNGVKRHLGYLHQRVEVLEGDFGNTIKKENASDGRPHSELENEITLLKQELHNLKHNMSSMVTYEVQRQLGGIDADFYKIATGALDGYAGSGIENFSEPDFGKTPSNGHNGKVIDFKPKAGSSIPSEKRYLPEGKELIAKSIMELYEQDYTIPQIASELKMCRGEIELIIKMNTFKIQKRCGIA